MIKRNHIAKVIISIILALFFWTFTCMNISLYSVYTTELVFRLGYFITALVSSAAVCALGVIKVNLGKRAELAAGIAAYIISIFGAMEISILFSDGFSSSPTIFFINILFYLAFAMIGLLVSGSMRVSAITALAVSYVFNAISFIVYSFRGSSLMPSDLLAFGTAMNVASHYEFKLKYQMITATIMTVGLMMTAFKFPLRIKFRRSPIILRSAAAAALACITGFITLSDFSDLDVSVYDQYYANLMYGSAFSFYVNGTKMGLEKRDDYDPDKLEEMLLSYSQEDETEDKEENTGKKTAGSGNTNAKADTKASVTEENPNIIVIMNESFSDLSVINDFETNEEYMPFFNSLEENTIRGQLFVSPFGGYTCNTEYEFLTGMSTGVLNARSAPYLQMMFSKLPYSFNTHMKALGYKTIALHPYYADGWNRNIVYDYLSFDKFVSLENLTEYTEYPEYIRGYVSDKSSYDAILNILYSKDSDERDFIFNITMQNHGSYDDDSFESEIFLQNMNGSYPETEQYLTLMKYSDEAFAYLLASLQSFDEPTVVLMFGDHMPNIEREFYEELYGTSLDKLGYDQPQKRYLIPFVLWANYDIESDDDVHTSPCYLSNVLMDAVGLPKSRVQLYLDDLRQEVAQINPMGYYDAGGYWHELSESDRIGEYYNLQYALLTGERLSYDFQYDTQVYEMFGTHVIAPHFVFGEEYERVKKLNSNGHMESHLSGPSATHTPVPSETPAQTEGASKPPDSTQTPVPTAVPTAAVTDKPKSAAAATQSAAPQKSR